MENIPDREFSGVETGGKLRIENQKNQEIMESYLLHDANASSNFKIMMMIQKEGMKGYGIYWMILEFLRVQNGYKADVRILPVLARILQQVSILISLHLRHLRSKQERLSKTPSSNLKTHREALTVLIRKCFFFS